MCVYDVSRGMVFIKLYSKNNVGLQSGRKQCIFSVMN